MRRKKEWFDDDAFWIELYPFMFSEQRFSDAADQADQLVKLTNPQREKVLDLCCGPGRFSIPLAAKGFSVTGVDRTAFLLEKARVRAKKARVRVEWVQKDMRDFIRPEAFHMVVSMSAPSDISTIDGTMWTSFATLSRTSSRGEPF